MMGGGTGFVTEVTSIAVEEAELSMSTFAVLLNDGGRR